eukprot:Skav206158  [mRNA]  locus=scaffold1545:172776:173006:- [translate_table: standard]
MQCVNVERDASLLLTAFYWLLHRLPVLIALFQAVQLMKEGDKWEIYIPSKLGYGDEGMSGGWAQISTGYSNSDQMS